jgi:hypothetical protein
MERAGPAGVGVDTRDVQRGHVRVPGRFGPPRCRLDPKFGQPNAAWSVSRRRSRSAGNRTGYVSRCMTVSSHGV